MSDNIDQLNRFLGYAKSRLNQSMPVHVVVGNEAADLDSIVSSLLYAYFLHQTMNDEQTLFMPLNLIPRDDFKLRTEAVYLLDRLAVDSAGLLFLDDINMDRLCSAQRIRFTLVDHNRPAAWLSAQSAAVIGIIDHHRDEGLYPYARPRMIEPVGSAATLVAEIILEQSPGLVDAGTAALLLGTILLDTVNLDEVAQRTTSKDRAVAQQLAKRTSADPNTLYQTIESAKFNASGLSTHDLLRKDYKQWTAGNLSYGISSLLISLKAWMLKDPALIGGLDTFMKARGIALLITMNAYNAPAFCRELCVYSPDHDLNDRVVAILNTTDMNLKPIDPGTLSGGENVALFTQGNVTVSRKKLQPLLQSCLA